MQWGRKMTDFMAKLKNWWWYNKRIVIVAVIVAAVLVYSVIPTEPKADYHVALVSAQPHSEAELLELESKLAAYAVDINGDGKTAVKVHFYPVDLADDDPNAGSNNYQFVSALDADLVGHVSELFILEDAEVFQRVTNHFLTGEFKRFEGLTVGIRKDAVPEAVEMFEKLG